MAKILMKGNEAFGKAAIEAGCHYFFGYPITPQSELPEYLSREDVPQEQVEKEMEIFKEQAMNEGKPAEIAEKMVHGRIGKFYGEICLLDQEFVKDSSVKVGDLINSKGAKLVAFARLEKGEGIEKKEENFAEEVMKQLQ